MKRKYLLHAAAISGIALIGLAAAFRQSEAPQDRGMEPHSGSLAMLGGALMGIALVRRHKFPPVVRDQSTLVTPSGHLTLRGQTGAVQLTGRDSEKCDQVGSGA